MPGSSGESGSHGLRARTITRFREVERVEPFWWVKFVGSPFARPGVPDFLCCYAGRMGALELKRKGRDSTARQVHEQGSIGRAGAVVMVAKSMDDVENFLDRLSGKR